MVVEEGSLIIGALLSTALQIGPAATALRPTHKMGWAVLWSMVLGTMATWIGIVLAYAPRERGGSALYGMKIHSGPEMLRALMLRSPRGKER